MPTADQIGGIIRWAVGIAGTWAVSSGWVSATSVAGITSVISVVGMALWSYYTNSQTALAAAAAKVAPVK